MVKIRLSRHGRKKYPFYRIVVSDSRSPRDGKFIEQIGFFSSINNIFYLNYKKLNFWIKNGAKCTKKLSFLIKKNKSSF
ncbi:MAG: 30S ribosomal protein S16 [Enterobacteriaceae bacterium]